MRNVGEGVGDGLSSPDKGRQKGGVSLHQVAKESLHASQIQHRGGKGVQGKPLEEKLWTFFAEAPPPKGRAPPGHVGTGTRDLEAGNPQGE